MTFLAYTLMTILIVLIAVGALYLVCMASMFWIGGVCQICRLFKPEGRQPKTAMR
jgi:uncharacterized membrane protein YjdF